MNKQKTLEVQLKKNRGENKNQSYSRKCHKRDQFTEKKKLTLNKINPNKIYFDLDHASNSKRQIVNQVKIKNENRSEIEIGINIQPYVSRLFIIISLILFILYLYSLY
ncbi:unnamed protein product [Paramecium sonneborni]|uniref:Uncharacterized protein n=1 Tax=Paramecium sonneborni TaxID=65129 RepID=A0A8S1KHE3_9CILI|nr:unnamed protein product [Paramecium sonneborni]